MRPATLPARSDRARSPTVAVVGGGWAGCAAAAALARAGRRVIVLEAGHELGGRARRVELALGTATHQLDNGQHLLLGAFRATAALMSDVGLKLDDVLLRQAFAIVYPDGMRLRAGAAPAPWHLATALIGARGFTLRERLCLASLLPRARRAGWHADPELTAAAWLQSMGQTPRLIDRIWRPLTLAALNTPLDRASARILACVLRDSLGASRAAAEMWLPRTDLSALLPVAVERLVQEHGGEVRRGARVDLLRCAEQGWSVAVRGSGEHVALEVDQVVYAAPPLMLTRVLGLHVEALRPLLRLIERFSYEPITTVYLKYPATVRLAQPMMALVDDPAARRYGQWLFDRGALNPAHAGILATVISASGPHDDEPLDQLGDAVAQQLSEALALPPPQATRAIVERRATLAATPQLKRPHNTTPLRGLVLAGDWTESNYPSTLETAVRSGQAAAHALLRN